MSWFDTTGFASLAKTALKEAQKTIDKALDIKDEDRAQTMAQGAAGGSSNFFDTWGLLKEAAGDADQDKEINMNRDEASSTSIWGSFTGSFFDNTKGEMKGSKSFPESSSIASLDESGNDKGLLQHLSSMKKSNASLNGSESVEVLSTQSSNNTDCTNSPDSEVNSSSASVGHKVNSESVEILADDSLVTTPSSVELVSDVWSTMDENESDGEDVKSSTSTLEGSQQLASSSWRSSRSKDEQDEPSQADDSYASASESTLLTIVEQQLTHDSCPDLSLDSPLKDNKPKLVPSVHHHHHHHQQQQQQQQQQQHHHHHHQVPIEAITKQPIRKPPFVKCSATTIEPATAAAAAGSTLESMAAADSSNSESLTRSSGSEQYLMLTDSSCGEETLIGSSSEENATSGAAKAPRCTLSGSAYVKSMLAEAMLDKSGGGGGGGETTEPAARDNSPVSSESRSDLVKIGSDHASGHTSGDELETTTSSDIEIISSPNGGDSSCCSTQSRQSPAKLQSCKGADLLPLLTRLPLKTRGHSRELSEISVGSDDTNLEIERLLRRIREMTEILEARESKLIEVSRSNMELHEHNSSLKRQLDNVEKHAEHSQDITQITDDYTQRLSALERKFQQAIRERDSLRKEAASSCLSPAQISNINAEKDDIIKELREEGDKLSKQQLQLSNIIKKLRAKEKENDALIKNQNDHLEEQSTELERLKRSLHAKEEVERNQIEAVHALTTKSKRQEREILSLGEQLDHITNKMEAYKASFDAAKAELIEVKVKLSDAKEQLKLAAENAGESHQLFSQVEELKSKLRLVEEAHVGKEKLLKQENVDLLKRLEAAESRNEEMCESVSQATIPLLRQIEQLQSSLTYKSNTFMRQEEAATDKIADLQSKLETITEMNRSLGEENANFKSRCSVLESKLQSRDADKKKLERMLETLKESNRKLADETEVHKHAMKMLEEAHATEIKEFKREITSLGNKLSMEKAATEAEKRKNQQQQQQQQIAGIDDETSLDMERESVSSAISVSISDVMFESSSGRFPNSTSTIENLQAQLKQREGEVQQLQWELSRRDFERDALNTEVSLLASKVEDMNSALAELEIIKANLNDIQTKYDALLQMYGEKVEENQELQLDLLDVKEMYKTQIDQLLQRDRI